MANTTTALDYQKCSGLIRKAQECISNIHKFTSNYVGASEGALEKSTEQQWLVDIVNTGNNIKQAGVELSEALDGAVDGLRKFDEDMRDFISSGISGDL